MTTRLSLLFLSISFLCARSLQAQPLEERPHLSCHYYKQHIPVEVLAQMERDADCGSNARSDSLDILNYAVTLDLTNFSQFILTASCEITFTVKQDGIERLPLDLQDPPGDYGMAVDSVLSPETGAQLTFDYDGLLLDVHLPISMNIGDTAKIKVYYHGKPVRDPSGFGGFVFDQGIAYNLGIGLAGSPQYNFGSSWHPCFDNFVERATYDINIISNGDRKGYAVGTFYGESDLGGGSILRQYRMSQPLPTYLVGSATSNYKEVHQTHSGAYGDYPILLVGKQADTTKMKVAFAQLPNAIDALEAWFGPYIWGQVGYVMTTAGAMEHSTLIAFPDYSIDGGATPGMNRLMAHELAHHWWGNVTTLSCPSDMWIKEGNAEYGSQLFTEFTFGRDYFDDVVKSNHLDVMRRAHLDDGGIYHPLSGIPYEYTYGTHTYNKGADIMHNLRGYLGDTLFRQGMSAMLVDLQYQSVDAQQFRDYLTAETGVDMTSFFDDWIYSPGFACFELDSVKYSPSGGGYAATIYVQQKLHHAPHFHTNVPLEITFYDENRQAHHATFMASGEFSVATVNVPFQPVWQILNDRNKLNLARMQNQEVVDETGGINMGYASVNSFDVLEVSDTALVSFVHYWAAPDPVSPNPSEVQISSTHYWRFGGVLPTGFRAKATLQYKGSSVNDFDIDLTGDTEDSLILVWRPDAATPWSEYPFYKKLVLGSTTDGNGFMRIDTLMPGDFAFANGSFPLVAAEETSNESGLKIFPNPANEGFTVEGKLANAEKLRLNLFDATGRLVKSEAVSSTGTYFRHYFSSAAMQPGMYLLKITSEDGRLLQVGKVLVHP